MQIQPTPPPPPADLSSWWDGFVVSFMAVGTLLVRGILKFLGFLLIILVGWMISAWIGNLVATILRKLHFNELAARTGLTGITSRMGSERDPSGLLGEIIKWLVRVVVLVIAFAALGLPALSLALNRFILWIPNLVIALAVLLIGGLAANALADVVRGMTADAGFRNPDTLANVTRIAIWVFAVVIAVNQVGIGDELVNTLLIALVSAAGLAIGLAFGLGGKDLASQVLNRWYQQAQNSRGRMEAAGDAARRRPGGPPAPTV